MFIVSLIYSLFVIASLIETEMTHHKGKPGPKAAVFSNSTLFHDRTPYVLQDLLNANLSIVFDLYYILN